MKNSLLFFLSCLPVFLHSMTDEQIIHIIDMQETDPQPIVQLFTRLRGAGRWPYSSLKVVDISSRKPEEKKFELLLSGDPATVAQAESFIRDFQSRITFFMTLIKVHPTT